MWSAESKWIIDEESDKVRWTRVSHDQDKHLGGKGGCQKIEKRESESYEFLRIDRVIEDSLTEEESQAFIATVPMEDANDRTSSSETNLSFHLRLSSA